MQSAILSRSRAGVAAVRWGLFIGVSAAEMLQGAELRLPSIFGHNMVLQRQSGAPVWGQGRAGEAVTVTVAGQTARGQVETNGVWRVVLAGLPTTAVPGTLRVEAGGESVTYTNVLIGDVWLGSGQSNLEFPVSGATETARFLAQADRPTVRLFRVAARFMEKPQADCDGQWVVCTPETVKSFSAALYFFGASIQERHAVPLGLIESAVGGTRIEPWTSREGFAAFPLLADYRFSFLRQPRSHAEYTGDALGKLDQIERWTQEARKALAEQKQPPLFPALYGYGYPEPLHRAGMLYNGSIHPLVPYGLRGFVWYQGEANETEQATYALKMEALVYSWRRAWGNGALPFYYAQIANWTGADDKPAGNMGYGWPAIRMGQLEALRRITNSGMAVTIDIGEGPDIHPRNKQDVGQRLALWARHNEYGEQKLEVSGPLYKAMERRGREILISFDHAGPGLMAGRKQGLDPVQEDRGGALRRFAIAGADRVWHWAEARIEGKDGVVVSSPAVAEPVAVRYAFSMNPEGCNLYNREGLPASPFRTDDWGLPGGAYKD